MALCHKNCTAHYPKAVRRCTAGGPLPTAPGQCGCCRCSAALGPHTVQCCGVPQEFLYLIPLGSAVVYRKSSATHGPHVPRRCTTGVPLSNAPRQCGDVLHVFQCPWNPGKEVVSCYNATAHCPPPPGQCDGVPQKCYCPLHQRHVVVYRRSSTTLCNQAVRECTGAVPLPTAPRRCGSVPHEFRCRLAPGSAAVHKALPPPTTPRRSCNILQEFHCPLPQATVAMCCMTSIAHCPEAMRQ